MDIVSAVLIVLIVTGWGTMMLLVFGVPKAVTGRAMRLLARRRLPWRIRQHLPRGGAAAKPDYHLIAALEVETGLAKAYQSCPECGVVQAPPHRPSACSACGRYWPSALYLGMYLESMEKRK